MSESRNPDNMDILLYAAAPYAGKNELDEFEKADESELSPKAEKRIFKKIQRRIDYYEKHEKFHPVFETLKRVAVIVLAVMSISFVSALSIEAVRSDIYNAVIQWFDKKLGISFDDIPTDAPDRILDYKEPVLPEGYERFEVRKDEFGFSVEYEDKDSLIIYGQSLLSGYSSFLSNEKTNIEDINVIGCDGIKTVFESHGVTTTTIIWKDNEYAYMLSSDLSYEELLRIAESIE